MAKLPLIPVSSGMRFQPVDTREVAARLVELAVRQGANLAPERAVGRRTWEDFLSEK